MNINKLSQYAVTLSRACLPITLVPKSNYIDRYSTNASKTGRKNAKPKCTVLQRRECEVAKARVWSCKGSRAIEGSLSRLCNFALSASHFHTSSSYLCTFTHSPSQLQTFAFATSLASLHFHIFALKAKMQRCKWFQWNTIVVKCQWNFFWNRLLVKNLFGTWK